MPSAPSLIAPKFGAYLEQLRGRLSRADFGARLRAECPLPMKLTGAVQAWERGRTLPPWPALIAYARVTRVPLDALLRHLVESLQTRDGRDLGCHFAGFESADAHSHHPLHVAALEADNDKLRADLERIVAIAGQLIAVAVTARKRSGAGAGTGAARPRGRRRG
jgi:transcriptional regulator with XRE-family HTH domain